MAKLPDLSSYLPTQAKEMLFQYFLAKILESPLNIYGTDTRYTLSSALDDVDKQQSQWLRDQARDQYDRAYRQWEFLHPLAWSNKEQRGFRRGVNDPKED